MKLFAPLVTVPLGNHACARTHSNEWHLFAVGPAVHIFRKLDRLYLDKLFISYRDAANTGVWSPKLPQ